MKKEKAIFLILCMILMIATGCANIGGTVSSSEAGQPQSEGAESQAPTSEPKELDLYTYYADSSIATVDEAVKAMEELYPDLTINIEHRADSDGSTLKTRAAVGELPDMFECVAEPLVSSFVQSGDILPLDNAITATGIFDEFLDGAFDINRYSDGKYYALKAAAPQCFLIFYNVDVFNKLNLDPPQNYDEMKSVVQKLSKSGRIPLALFGAEQWPGMQLFDLAVIGSGEPKGLTGLEAGETKITDASYVTAAKKLEELVSLGFIGKGALNTNASQAFELANTGEAGMVANGAWHFNTLVQDGMGEKIGYFSYNVFADTSTEETVRWNMSGGAPDGSGYCVSANSENPEFTAEVLCKFLAELSKAGAYINGDISALKNPPEPKEPRPSFYQEYVDSIPNFKSTTANSWTLKNPEVVSALGQGTELLLSGTYSADQFINDLNEQLPR